MPASQSDRERPRARRPLLANGIAALAFGLACLLLPVVLEHSARLDSLALVLRVPAALGLAVGVVLLALHWSARRHPRTSVEAAAPPSALPPPSMPAAAEPWSAPGLDELDPARFEALCLQLFVQAGFEVRPKPRTAPHCLDLCLYSKHAPGPVALARCRHLCGEHISVADVSDLYGLLVSHDLKRGTYVTNASFLEEAARYAREHGINPLGRGRLLALIASRSGEQQQELLAATAAAG